MKRNFPIIAFLSCFFIFGCSSTKLGYFCKSIVNPIPVHDMVLDDSCRHLYYSMTIGDEEKVDTILFFITGTGNASLQYYLKSYFQGLTGNIHIFALQPRHVTNRETGIFQPSEAYNQENTFRIRVEDNIKFILQTLANNRTSYKRIVVFGVSAGGTVASVAASVVPDVTHLVVLGEGGMKELDAFRLWGRKYGIDFDQEYKKIKADPDSTKKKFLGEHTYKWWASYLEVNPMDYLHSLEIPMLFCAGKKDEMVPVESLYYLRDRFEELGKTNLTVKLYPDCNHVLIDSKGISHRIYFMKFVSSWLRNTTIGHQSPPPPRNEPLEPDQQAGG